MIANCLAFIELFCLCKHSLFVSESTSVTQSQSAPEEEEPEEEEQEDDDTLPDLTGFIVDDMKQYVFAD